jgi:WD40 repeat protein/serine/threonine protein kinase
MFSYLKKLLGKQSALEREVEARLLKVARPSQEIRRPDSSQSKGGQERESGGAAGAVSPSPLTSPSVLDRVERHAQKAKLRMWRVGETILNTYRVEDIKKGGMGYVYIAEHRGWKTKVAIKAPSEMMLSNPSLFVRVLAEANAWIGLGLHPHIAFCYYVRQIEDIPHIFIEYVDGGSLRRWIAQRRCYDLKVGLDLAIQFCHGMEYAHSMKMIHRDIKPENILMTQEGILKITDFGIARMEVVSRQSSVVSEELVPTANGPRPTAALGMTKFGTVMGSVHYMSPEQWQDPHGVDERADIYSFGVCLYEMLCGRRPYDVSSLDAKQQRRTPCDPLHLRDDLPAPLVHVLTKGVRLERDGRYGSFAELRQELTDIYTELFHEDPPHGVVEDIALKADGMNNRAVSYVELGKEDEAQALWEEALKVDPHHLEATFNLGYLRWQRAQIPDDVYVTHMRELENSCGAEANYWRCLAWIHLERGDKDEIERILRWRKAEGGRRNEEDKSAIRHPPSAIDWAEDPDLMKALANRDRPVGRLQRILMGHADNVTAICFSPDGQYGLSGGADRTIRLWEIASGKEISRFEGHADKVSGVCFSPDGRYALSGSADGTVRMWDVRSGSKGAGERRSRGTAEQGFRSFASSPPSSLASPEGSGVWIVAGGNSPAGRITSVSLSPDGQHLLTGSEDNLVRLWEIMSGEVIRQFEGHTEWVAAVCFSPDGQYACTGGWDQTVRLWEIMSGREVQRFDGHGWVVSAVRFSSDGQEVLSGSWDQTIRMWEIASGKEIRRFEGHTNRVTSLGFSPDGRHVVSGGFDAAVRLWEVASRREIRRFEGHTQSVTGVSFSPDGRQILSASEDDTIRLWDVYYPEKRRFRAHPYPLLCKVKAVASLGVERTKARKLLISAQECLKKGSFREAYQLLREGQSIPGYERDRQILELFARCGAKGKRKGLRGAWPLYTLRGHLDWVTCVSFSPDGCYALSGSDDQTIRLWDVTSGKEIRRFEGHTMSVASVCFSPDSRQALSGGWDQTIRLWDVAGGTEIRQFEEHTGGVTSVCFSPDGRQALSGGYDQTIRLWEVESGTEMRRFEGHTDRVTAVAFSPDGRYALSGSIDQTVRLWEVESGAEVRRFEGHSLSVTSVQFSPDGKQVLSGSWDQTVRLWDVPSRVELQRFEGSTERVTSVSFSPDGRYVLSGSVDQMVRLWEVESGSEIRRFEGHTQDVTAVCFSSDGRYALSGSMDQTVRLWEIDWEWEFSE